MVLQKPHLWLVEKILPKTWDDCRETSERKARTDSYDDVVDLLIEFAMERENYSHMDIYLRKHLRRETPAEENPGGRSPHPHSNPGKGRGGHLKHMTETPPSKGKGAPNLFYCRPTDDKGGPFHAPDCDWRSACMLQLKHTQKTKDGQEVKHQDHFCCTITCGYRGKHRHYADECHIKRRESEKLKKAEEERRKNAGKGKPEGEAKTHGVPKARLTATLVEDQGPQSPPLVKEEHPTPHPRVSSRVKNGLSPRASSAGGADKNDNAKKHKLNPHSNCLQAAGVEVKFPEEG